MSQPDPKLAASLVLLDTADAQKLAAMWPHLQADERDSHAAWGSASGVSSLNAEIYGKPLRRSGICADDGTTNELALKYIAKHTLRGMK